MLEYFTSASLGGNARKISILLAETGLEHVVHLLDLERGDQFEPWFLEVHPNAKIPAIHDPETDVRIGESGAILVYLAEKTGMFLPTEPRARARALMWVFWQVGGIGPNFGQWSYFASRRAPEKVPFAIQRFKGECERLLGVLDHALADNEFVAGDYSIGDIALLSWVKPGVAAFVNPETGAHPWSNIARWIDAMLARPAVQLALSRPEGSALRIGRGADLIQAAA